MSTDNYTFRRLIIEKYGEAKFDLGCQLIGMFLSSSIATFTSSYVKATTLKPDSEFEIHQRAASKLITLFGPHTTEFFNSVTLKQ